MPSKSLSDIIRLIRNANGALGDAPTVEEIRNSADSLYDSLPIPRGANFLFDSAVSGTWSYAYGADKTKVILYFHGGGYVMHTPTQFRTLTAELSKETQTSVFAVDYRRAPEHRFPAAIEDAEKAYRWLLARGFDGASVVLAGDSAGGGICVAMMLLCKARNLPMPAAAFLISPWLDMTLGSDSISSKSEVDPIVSREGLKYFVNLYLGTVQAATHPLASPLLGDLTNLPPILIHVGSDEALLDDSVRFAGKAGAAGVNVTLEIWAKMIHEWHVWHTRLPEGTAAIRKASSFIRFHLGINRD